MTTSPHQFFPRGPRSTETITRPPPAATTHSSSHHPFKASPRIPVSQTHGSLPLPSPPLPFPPGRNVARDRGPRPHSELVHSAPRPLPQRTQRRVPARPAPCKEPRFRVWIRRRLCCKSYLIESTPASLVALMGNRSNRGAVCLTSEGHKKKTDRITSSPTLSRLQGRHIRFQQRPRNPKHPLRDCTFSEPLQQCSSYSPPPPSLLGDVLSGGKNKRHD